MQDFEHELIYERTDDMSVLSDFYCGVSEMDSFIHNSLQTCVDEASDLETYIVYEDGSVVALVAFKESVIEVEVRDKGTFGAPSLEIEYLAVKDSHQKKHIGTGIINWIFEQAKTNHPGCKFQSVRAYRDIDTGYSAVPFYRNFGFWVLKEPHPLSNNVKMARKAS